MNPQALNHGELLYRLPPSIFRSRDRATSSTEGAAGDLARYLAAGGALLDRIELTLGQMRLDSFADAEPEGEQSQDWVLPYIAELLDLSLAAEEAEGQREEIRRAVDWRQRKGTLGVLQEIALLVADLEIQLQEGWRRVALTPRTNEPLFLGSDAEARASAPGHTTVDVRYESRAVALDAGNAADQNELSARVGRFSGAHVLYRSTRPEGIPRFPESYQDVSRRTVDMRTPAAKGPAGRIHPGRVLLYGAAPPEPGTPRYQKLLHKLKDFLPVGIEVLLVADATLPDPPPANGATGQTAIDNASAAAAPVEPPAVTEPETTTP